MALLGSCWRAAWLSLVLAAAVLCGCPGPKPPQETPVYGYRVVNTYSHDPGAFTQGLVFTDGVLYESTGLYGRSSVRRVDLEFGEVLQQRDLAGEYFGEGLAVVGDRLIQLTWRNYVGFVYDRTTFEPLSEFQYATEGWGLAYDGTRLIMSDGSSTLYFLNPDTLAETGQIGVRENGLAVERLNELEYVEGEIYANIWQQDRIARIDPDTGQILGWIDLSGILPAEDRTGAEDVLNGIAYDEESGRLFVTGKLWPKLFEIELVSPTSLAQP